MKLIIDLLKEADPCFTDKKLFDLRKEKAIASLTYEINKYKLNAKIYTQSLKSNELYTEKDSQTTPKPSKSGYYSSYTEGEKA